MDPSSVTKQGVVECYCRERQILLQANILRLNHDMRVQQQKNNSISCDDTIYTTSTKKLNELTSALYTLLHKRNCELARIIRKDIQQRKKF